MEKVSNAQLSALMEMLENVEVPCELTGTCKKTIKHSLDGKKDNPITKKKVSRTDLKKSFKLNCELFIKLSVENTKKIPPDWCCMFYHWMIMNQEITDAENVQTWMQAYHYYYSL